ncbi:hypothetical protein MVEN_00745100 [Mycena venus]|uniref:Uncharacterized protein n=1 Tax=Mycena venus TaxID=2733690 RepID=A0A8H6YK46_9AGAR|nr:hypothetical protein MVEN_00745100 [Mycena venus]
MLSHLSSFFAPHASTPPPADMRCIPCTGIDVSVRDLVLTTGLVVNARLDAKRLEQSLSMLVEHKFPRAGARLALRNGVYEFQIPRTFNSSIRPTAFTLEDRPATCPELPTDLVGGFASQPAIFSLPDEGYFKSKSCPTTLEGFLVPNTPLIHVHAVVFDDATFIGITSSHMTFDALGTRTLVHAWARLLNGEDIDAIPGMEWDVAPFETFTGPTTMTHQRGWFVLSLLPQLIFIVFFMLRIVRDPKEEGRLVRIPKRFLEDSKNEIMRDLKRQGSAEWVGSSDIILAWWFKSIYNLRNIGDTTPIHIHLPINLRDKHIFPGGSTIGTPYINNAVDAISLPPVSVTDLQTESLGDTALRFRRAIIAYNADLPAIQADVQWRCANPFVDRFPCPPRAEYSFQTNWRAANFGDLDFSGARAQGTEEEEKTRVLLAVGYVSSSKNIPMRGAGGMFMEDEDAVWMFQIRGTKDWENVRRSGRIAFA